MKTGKIVCFTMIILLFCAAAWPTGCGTAAGSESKEGMPKTASEANGPAAPVSRDEEPAETAPEDTVIHFLDPVIEAETRRILNKPAGDIMKKEVLGITDFGVDREYEDYDSLGKIGSVSGEIATLKDLQWFKNLKVLILSDCDLDSLEGIEELTELRVLYVRRNRLRDIEPVRNLEHLAYFDCAYNNIDDYSALCSLTEMKELGIGDNGMAYTDLSPLENMTRLSALYAPFCGIDDISVLKNMPDLEYLQLFHNDISDISALANLEKLDYLELGLNKIKNIDALSGLKRLTHINLESNPIPQDDLEKYYTPKEEDYFDVTFCEKIRDDMPELQFVLRVCINKKRSSYSVDSITVSDTADGKIMQTISIPEKTLFGETNISVYEEDMGFELEDVNFDGYRDIRLFDTANGNYRLEWIYLVWDPDKSIFEQDTHLNAISLATFDQEKQLIYGMERGSAFDHYYSTYRYIDGLPVEVKYECVEHVYQFSPKRIQEYLSSASIETEATDFKVVHEMEQERNDATGEMETRRDIYEIYPENSEIFEDDPLFCVDVESELGRLITGETDS